MTKETKKKIDAMSYQQMLDLWRNAPSPHPYFTGEVGEYFANNMAQKKDLLSSNEQVSASKSVGWGG